MEKPAQEHPDKELFLQFCRGHHASTKLVYDSCYPSVRKMVRKSSKVEEDVEDTFQAGLLGLLAYCKKKSFVLTTPLCGLLYRICENIWRQKLGKRGRLDISSQDFSQYLDLSKALEIEEKAIRRAERWQLIWKHLHRLTEKEQRVLKLFYVEDKSHQEIADIMGFASANAAKVQKYRYLQKLIAATRNDPDFE